MATLKVSNLHPYDGEYEIPPAGWTNRELHYIKQVCGVRAGELEDATKAGDVGVLVALSAVILQRAGHQVNIELLWDASESNFDVITDDETLEDEDRPPATATAGGRTSEPDAAASVSEKGSSSGGNGAPAGESSPPTRPATGSPGSEEPAAFDLATSEN